MFNPRFARSVLLFVFVCMAFTFAGCAHVGTAGSGYKPTVGQSGKDVVWVPTAQGLVDQMLDMAKVTAQDYVIDLGSGDGRTVITAAKRGARALGIEYNPDMVALSKRNAAKAGVAGNAQFVQGDIFQSDFSQATVVTMFLLPQINVRLRPQILDMKPGTRVVSNSFDMAEWVPDQTYEVQDREKCTSFCTAYFWVVPAKVGGTWKLPAGELSLTQSFQMISGKLASGGAARDITNGRLNGEQITFTAGDTTYIGRVSGNEIKGTFAAGAKTGTWSANRVSTTPAN